VSRVIAIANQKGGVGKTTTAINLGAGLAVAEQRTLIVDMDPQGNATSGLGFDKNSLERSVYDVLVDGTPVQDSILTHVHFPFLDLLPSSQDLVGALSLSRLRSATSSRATSILRIQATAVLARARLRR